MALRYLLQVTGGSVANPFIPYRSENKLCSTDAASHVNGKGYTRVAGYNVKFEIQP